MGAWLAGMGSQSIAPTSTASCTGFFVGARPLCASLGLAMNHFPLTCADVGLKFRSVGPLGGVDGFG